MRSTKSRMRTGVVGLALLAGFIALPPSPAHAGTASPSNYNIDCSALTPPGTTVTGAVGDTFTITNTSATVCSLMGEAGIVSGMSAIGPAGPNGVETYAILGEGTFTVVTFNGSSSGSASVQVVLGSPGQSTDRQPGVGEPRAIDLPGNPSAVTATSLPGSIQVNWTAPTWSGADAITKYAVFYTGQTSTNALCYVPVTTTSCTLSRLQYGKNHTFYVQAQSPIGWSTPSPASNAVAMGGLIPGAPTIWDFARFGSRDKAVFTAAISFATGPYGVDDHIDYQVARCPKPCSNPNDSLDWLPIQSAGETAFFPQVPDMKSIWALRVRQVSDSDDVSAWVYQAEERTPWIDAPKIYKAMLDADGRRISLAWEPDEYSDPWTSKYRISYQTSNKPWTTPSTSAWKDLFPVWNTSTRFVLDPEYVVRYARFRVAAVDIDGNLSPQSEPSEWVEIAGSAPGS